MRMRITVGTSIDDIEIKSMSGLIERTIARTERIIEPDGAGAIDSNARNMRATGGTAGGRHVILCHTLLRTIRCLADNQLPNSARKSIAPPDIALLIIGNQMGSDVTLWRIS